MDVVDRIFDAFIKEPKALLGDGHAQHPLPTNRRMFALAALRVKRLELRAQRRLRHGSLNRLKNSSHWVVSIYPTY